jgi:hypothetical protein
MARHDWAGGETEPMVHGLWGRETTGGWRSERMSSVRLYHVLVLLLYTINSSLTLMACVWACLWG